MPLAAAALPRAPQAKPAETITAGHLRGWRDTDREERYDSRPGKPEGSSEPMTIKVGDQIPSMKLMMGTPEGPKETTTDEIFKGKKVVLFAVPGAFTPTCSAKHLPGFVLNVDAIKAKGVDTVACIAVNDAFVMAAWGKEQGTDGKLTMLADGSAAFTKAIGLELDLVGRGMGTRSQRYALIAQDGKVTHLAVEQPGGFEVSKAESILANL
jgi:peroxiredoxin (alkyl hydroperoxide reductase subunit C)